MTKIMSSGGCLYHDMIKTTKIMEQFMIFGAEQPYRDRSSHRCHLDRVGQPVVHDSAGRHRGDYLGHVGQPGEGGGEPNPLQVNAECRFPRRVRGVRLFL